jgi:hypothetical protein
VIHVGSLFCSFIRGCVSFDWKNYMLYRLNPQAEFKPFRKFFQNSRNCTPREMQNKAIERKVWRCHLLAGNYSRSRLLLMLFVQKLKRIKIIKVEPYVWQKLITRVIPAVIADRFTVPHFQRRCRMARRIVTFGTIITRKKCVFPQPFLGTANNKSVHWSRFSRLVCFFSHLFTSPFFAPVMPSRSDYFWPRCFSSRRALFISDGNAHSTIDWPAASAAFFSSFQSSSEIRPNWRAGFGLYAPRLVAGRPRLSLLVMNWHPILLAVLLIACESFRAQLRQYDQQS